MLTYASSVVVPGTSQGGDGILRGGTDWQQVGLKNFIAAPGLPVSTPPKPDLC
jgi:hypothetical protein